MFCTWKLNLIDFFLYVLRSRPLPRSAHSGRLWRRPFPASAWPPTRPTSSQSTWSRRTQCWSHTQVNRFFQTSLEFHNLWTAELFSVVMECILYLFCVYFQRLAQRRSSTRWSAPLTSPTARSPPPSPSSAQDTSSRDSSPRSSPGPPTPGKHYNERFF